MKKLLFFLMLLSFTSYANPKKILYPTVLTYKGDTIYMDPYSRCYIIIPNYDTIDVTRRIRNIKYNNKKIK